MRESSIDPERLAALFDGRLNARERDQLLEELVASDDQLDVLGDFAELMSEFERTSAVAGVAPVAYEPKPEPILLPVVPAAVVPADMPSPAESGSTTAWNTFSDVRASDTVLLHSAPSTRSMGRGRRLPIARRAAPWLALLATAAVVFVVVNPSPSRSAVNVDAYSAITAFALESGNAPFPSFSWSMTRGITAPGTRRSRAIQFGARALELDKAVRARDIAVVVRVATQTAMLIDQPGSGSAPQIYQRIAQNPEAPFDSLTAWLREGWATGTALLGGQEATLGAWLAAARIASASRNAGFFRTPASRNVIEVLIPLANADDVATREASTRLRRNVEGSQALPDWEVLQRDVETLLRALGA